jgi:hypothetical protein
MRIIPFLWGDGGAPVVEHVRERTAYGAVVRAVEIHVRHRLDCVGARAVPERGLS